MINYSVKKILCILFIIVSNICIVSSQQIPIQNYSVNDKGQVQLEVNSELDQYYVLKVRHDINDAFEIATALTLGEANSTIITEPLSNYPIENYQVLEYPIASPFDTDEDGIDDITEFQNFPIQSALNAAISININDGITMINDFTAFKNLAVIKNEVEWSEFLNGKEFVKYIIVDFNTAPKIYFINSNQYNLHQDFANAVGIDYSGNEVKKGQIIYHPTHISNNGTVGTFVFNYSNGNAQNFDVVQKTHELLAANMPFVENNLSYYITENNESQYIFELLNYQNSRVSVVFESEIFAGIDYWGLNPAEGFGFFRKMALEEIPGSRDIVLYESLPNNLPRVGGIITSVIQTPLSHVNLRAIQNNIPNAFIRDPLAIDYISNLLDDYIYYKVEENSYTIRKATSQEVNDWYENIRPVEEQNPPLNLDYTNILPLDEITFKMFDAYGAKCTNLATMQTFDFPENTIPNGYGIPFYYYQEFMNYHNFFDDVTTIINNPVFIADRNVRDEMLSDFRAKIKAVTMPEWMMNDLSEMHSNFPEGISVRCRSSSNNEDLAGFNGAGLYDSKTQHPNEGHISKSIKQVFASLWNLRAFEERDFYRINHYKASMGILCHPNFTDEKANGVGVSTDPIYGTDKNFYLNTQVGEELITNPENNSIPEEILLERNFESEDGYIVLQYSNLIPNNTAILSEQHLQEMRTYLTIIHDKFKILYEAANIYCFAMDIEYKITNEDQLVIKQARPWVSCNLHEDVIDSNNLEIKIFPNPANEIISVECKGCNLTKLSVSNIMGQQMLEQLKSSNSATTVIINNLPSGLYVLNGFDENNVWVQSKKFVKQ